MAVAMSGPVFSSRRAAAAASRTMGEKKGMAKVSSPPVNAIAASMLMLGLRSASTPPSLYPIASDARTTPIKLPQTNIVLPKTGARRRLAAISKLIATAPETNTTP